MPLDLLKLAEANGISVEYWDFAEPVEGIYISDQRTPPVIGISKKIKTEAQLRCILAEELGHHLTSIGEIIDQAKLPNRKQELRARKWSYEKLVPLDNLVQAYKEGIKGRHELAEYLQVSEEFLAAAVQHYKEKHGIYRRVGEYWICFEPLGVLESFE